MMNADTKVGGCMNARYNRVVLPNQSLALCGHAWTDPPISRIQRPKPSHVHNQVVVIFDLFLHHLTPQVTNPLVGSITVTSRRPRREKRKNIPNRRFCITPNALFGTSVQLHMDKTHLFCIFRMAPAKKIVQKALALQEELTHLVLTNGWKTLQSSSRLLHIQCVLLINTLWRDRKK